MAQMQRADSKVQEEGLRELAQSAEQHFKVMDDESELAKVQSLRYVGTVKAIRGDEDKMCWRWGYTEHREAKFPALSLQQLKGMTWKNHLDTLLEHESTMMIPKHWVKPLLECVRVSTGSDHIFHLFKPERDASTAKVFVQVSDDATVVEMSDI